MLEGFSAGLKGRKQLEGIKKYFTSSNKKFIGFACEAV